MLLFSYVFNEQVRSARLVEGFGIDLCLAGQLFLKSQKPTSDNLFNIPTTMVDLLILGQDSLLAVKIVTDWIIKSLPGDEKQLRESGIVFDLKDVTYVAPVLKPGKVICVAGNYPAQNKLDKPDFPTIFLKPSSGVIGTQQLIILPSVAKNVFYEVELAVIIGKKGKNHEEDSAACMIAGYTIANDLGDRVLEKRTSQWTSGKMFDTFTPMGPIMITSDELIDTCNLNMFTKVNGQYVQKGNTNQMFFDVQHLVNYISALTTLEPGDVILTGSPKMMDGEPNPSLPLQPGDVVEVSIEGLSSLINSVVSDDTVNK
jgi:acylpyruvate hydrolase